MNVQDMISRAKNSFRNVQVSNKTQMMSQAEMKRQDQLRKEQDGARKIIDAKARQEYYKALEGEEIKKARSRARMDAHPVPKQTGAQKVGAALAKLRSHAQKNKARMPSPVNPYLNSGPTRDIFGGGGGGLFDKAPAKKDSGKTIVIKVK